MKGMQPLCPVILVPQQCPVRVTGGAVLSRLVALAVGTGRSATGAPPDRPAPGPASPPPRGDGAKQHGVEEFQLEERRPTVHRLHHVDPGVAGRPEELLRRHQRPAGHSAARAAVGVAGVMTRLSSRCSSCPAPRRIIGPLWTA